MTWKDDDGSNNSKIFHFLLQKFHCKCLYRRIKCDGHFSSGIGSAVNEQHICHENNSFWFSQSLEIFSSETFQLIFLSIFLSSFSKLKNKNSAMKIKQEKWCNYHFFFFFLFWIKLSREFSLIYDFCPSAKDIKIIKDNYYWVSFMLNN